MEIDYTECHYYVDGICFNEKCMTKYCEGYECLFKKYHKAIAENKELKEMMFVAESALMKQNKIYRQVLHDIEEICRKTPILNKPVCSLIDSILQKIQEVNGNEK